MIFVSYYTSGIYETVMRQYLLPSLQKWHLNHEVMEVNNLGTWQLNTSFKASFLLQMLLKHKQDICFIDADATIEQYPTLLYEIPNDYEIAVHYLLWDKYWHNKDNNKHVELLSGTMVLKYNEATLELLDSWISALDRNVNIKEQKVLQTLLENLPNYKVYNLPVEYCAIKKPDGSIPSYIKEPIILHHQVSRKYRKNNGKS